MLVGKISIPDTMASDVIPFGSLAGHCIIRGTRIPPSHFDPFKSRNCPLSAPLFVAAPLSFIKMIKVFS